jgi:methionyl-tRNA formyltransferase
VSAGSGAAPRAVVCAYGEVGCAALEALLEVGLQVALVVTHEDSPGEVCWFRSVRDLALRAGIPVIAPADVAAPDVRSRLEATEPDFLFSFYFRRMLGRPSSTRRAAARSTCMARCSRAIGGDRR